MQRIIFRHRDEAARLVASPQVDKISFTGSVPTGRKIAEVTAARFARVTLELGGKSAAILLDDVVLPQAMQALAPFTMSCPYLTVHYHETESSAGAF